MKIIEKMKQKMLDNYNCEGATIAFLGDSVTQGCFDVYKNGEISLETYYDQHNSYERRVFDILSTLYPSVPINIINAGISGDTAPRGLARVERDVIGHKPDLCIVCYALNDCGFDADRPDRYTNAMRGIFEKLKAADIEIIYLTPNMMNTEISHHLTDPYVVEVAENHKAVQLAGKLDLLIDRGRELCREMDIPVCDCYAMWKTLAAAGVNTTELLSNKINHPTKEMNMMFAYELVRCMFEK